MNRLAKLAFTLAEVLIVLGIIGVVAEMTIPTLLQSSEKQVEMTSLKKFYSEFSQAMTLYMQSSDCSDLPCTGLFNADIGEDDYADRLNIEFAKVLRLRQATTDLEFNRTIKYLDGSVAVPSFAYGPSWITDDGFQFMVYDTDSGNCTMWEIPAKSSLKLYDACTTLYLDTNGVKMPNKWGRDIHLFFLAKDGNLYPWSGADHKAMNGSDWTTDSTFCGVAGSAAIPTGDLGTGCVARIIQEGWQMKY